MAQKRVPFKVAKALKEAGYPQNDYDEMIGSITKPTYIDVWLWLWMEKKIRIELVIDDITDKSYPIVNRQHDWLFDSDEDPEESIIAAIDYLADNNLIK